MLKLELVRFSFSPVITYGVMHDRAGWSCFTIEGVVRNILAPIRRGAALPEGLYLLSLNDSKPATLTVHIRDVADEPPIATLLVAYPSAHLFSDIHICAGVDMDTRTPTSPATAGVGLLRLMKAEKECYLNIRHLDNTQLLHFERMAREAIQ